ncbi:MAG: ComF family protein, partial [Candidatus Binatia bacterium]
WLARALARRCGLPFSTTSLRRSDQRPAQRELGGALRRRNARGAFALGRERLQGYSVVLVDDVATTGATLGDAARCLHEGGAAVVLRLALACADDKASLECLSRTGSTGSIATANPPR